MDRKQIVKMLEEKFNVKAKYLGLPSLAHQIEIGSEIYKISKDGTITSAEGHEFPLEFLLSEKYLDKEGQDHELENVDIPEGEDGILDYEIKLPMEHHNAKTLRNLANMIYSKQILLKKALEIQEDLITEDFIYQINQISMEGIKEFEDAIKNTVLSKSQGLQFDFEDKTFGFKMKMKMEKIDSATKLFGLINQNALIQHYASFKVKPITNEKYTFRTWLLRLGMIGDEYKSARKSLLKNLSGNGAFRNGPKDDNSNEA